MKKSSSLLSTYSHPQYGIRPIVSMHPERNQVVEEVPDQFLPSLMKSKPAVAENLKDHVYEDKHHTTNKGKMKEPIKEKQKNLESYVHAKYGTPRTQLQNLSEKGSYKTTTIDSSGIGSGPMLNYPVEALICLPTPRHNCGGSCDQEEKCTVNTTDETDTSVAHLTSGKLIYTTGQETDHEVIGGLQFESRFESGNLSQAIRL